MDIVSYILGYKSGAKGGGGAVEGVHYVTFLSEDGLTELYKRPVADGDDCADPVARGYISTPVKESTAQYDYSYKGWSSTIGGSANSEVLKAVTEDKSVYTVFTSTVRYYSVTYYDSDGTTVLKTESLAYGKTPTYIPEKNGASFVGWTTPVEPVTGDAAYYAQWEDKLTFAGASWADIAEISARGEAEQYFKVGDEKDVTFSGNVLTLQIAGFNHDDLADGSGKASMTLICKNLPYIQCYWSSDQTYMYTTIPAFLDNDCKNLLPAELQSVIKQVSKPVDSTKQGGFDQEIKQLNCYLFLLSLDELNADLSTITTSSNPRDRYSQLGTPYALFPTPQGDGDFLLRISVYSSTGAWLTRHTCRVGQAQPVFADGKGNLTVKKYSELGTVFPRFGFCI